MRESSDVVRPQPMESATYSASSRLQAAGLISATKLFEQAAAQVPIPAPPQPIAIADYGAANGYNSLLPVGAAVAVLRARTRLDHAILVAHTDLPDNDFTALFTTLTEDPDSYLAKDSATFPSAVGRSFYRQILPSESIALGWSSWATHWLSRVPAPIQDHIHIAHSAEADARRAFTQQAALDWQDFLAFRGRELAPGGRLVVLTLGIDDAGLPGFGGVMQALLTALQGLVEVGTLYPQEVARMAIPTVGRSEEEFRAPFAPSGRFEDSRWNTSRRSPPRTGSGRATAMTATPPHWDPPGPASRGPRSSPPWPPRWRAARAAREPSPSSTPSNRRSPPIWPRRRSR